MAIDITVPQLGESIVEATVVQWFKQEGDPVTTGEALLELETEKVTLEVNANDSGVLSRIERAAGEDVRIGDLLGVLDESGEAAATDSTDSAGSTDSKGASADESATAAEPASAIESGSADEPPVSAREASGPSQAVTDDRVTPVARRIADEAGISLSDVEGTGMGGRIRREDVERAVATRAAEPTAPEAEPAARAAEPTTPAADPVGDDREEIVPMSRRRRTIASRLVEAQQTAAMLTTFNEIDMSTVMTIRRRNREAFEERHGVRLGFMSFFVKAVIGALRDFPELNAEIRGDAIVRKHYYDIGIAVGAEDGLVVPVLRDAVRMSFAEIESNIRQYAAKAGEGKLSLEDLRGGTFTITNGGVFGSMLSTPILNPPQVGILGLHRIDDRPVAVDGEVVIRPMMYVALSYDHRIIDGREAVQFLARVKSLIEVPAALLLEV
ncbi:MAG: 2-oxoglutarate dehydrogenase complex dihydrolipoyllysine-residue succinyltransferase [Gemmatimonadetes bacterium]|nr:2-oxoglutarate dehydrogenase complex dihydrolipoyllysine-residue succinyltransferase [Gemmatimonadota bacterium]MYG86109.1 2-oxoglutarate dehydrogenase complex dihydrolipoyllysine-residue succinyltransferase [Gemmatimonadota bacterium]MYJ90391.1 2-oxoglutarate dehydrogenase complex dihydrolipoyllysine-residue succinyltransferase [Gemmatimonadota bacterium]